MCMYVYMFPRNRRHRNAVALFHFSLALIFWVPMEPPKHVFDAQYTGLSFAIKLICLYRCESSRIYRDFIIISRRFITPFWWSDWHKIDKYPISKWLCVCVCLLRFQLIYITSWWTFCFKTLKHDIAKLMRTFRLWFWKLFFLHVHTDTHTNERKKNTVRTAQIF